MGLLFEIWIVDASIFVVCCVHCHVWSICGVAWVVGLCLSFWFRPEGWVGPFVVGCRCVVWWLGVGWVGGVCDKL